MFVEWKDELSIHIDEIDEQHKEFINRLNMLFRACQTGKAKEEVSDVMHFLEDYILDHFFCEETVQSILKYPDFEKHKKQHDDFVETFIDLKQKILSSTDTEKNSKLVKDVLINWLIEHIAASDKAVGAFIKETIDGRKKITSL